MRGYTDNCPTNEGKEDRCQANHAEQHHVDVIRQLEAIHEILPIQRSEVNQQVVLVVCHVVVELCQCHAGGNDFLLLLGLLVIAYVEDDAPGDALAGAPLGIVGDLDQAVSALHFREHSVSLLEHHVRDGGPGHVEEISLLLRNIPPKEGLVGTLLQILFEAALCDERASVCNGALPNLQRHGVDASEHVDGPDRIMIEDVATLPGAVRVLEQVPQDDVIVEAFAIREERQPREGNRVLAGGPPERRAVDQLVGKGLVAIVGLGLWRIVKAAGVDDVQGQGGLSELVGRTWWHVVRQLPETRPQLLLRDDGCEELPRAPVGAVRAVALDVQGLVQRVEVHQVPAVSQVELDGDADCLQGEHPQLELHVDVAVLSALEEGRQRVPDICQAGFLFDGVGVHVDVEVPLAACVESSAFRDHGKVELKHGNVHGLQRHRGEGPELFELEIDLRIVTQEVTLLGRRVVRLIVRVQVCAPKVGFLVRVVCLVYLQRLLDAAQRFLRLANIIIRKLRTWPGRVALVNVGDGDECPCLLAIVGVAGANG
mmetsp:Transcript_43633/g.138269  ORF Transcript_43633/g.138269 Transcript_43633/m.138269 type:complete len:541 (-) Transcript_43633:1359-2981(-)